MRYIIGSDGYLKEVSFGAEITCGGVTCVEYTGTIPSGYNTLFDWYIAEADNLYQWKIVSGNLTKDTSVTAKTDVDDKYILGAKTPILSGNLNNYTTAGSYVIVSNAVAKNITNLPIAGTAGTLTVENVTGGAGYGWSMAYLVQTYKTYTAVECVRRSTDSGANWTDWEILDTGWITPTLGSGFEVYSTDQAVQYRKVNKLVEIRGSVKPTSNIDGSATNYTIFTLPEGYRPNKQVNVVCHGSSWYTWLLSVASTGDVRFSRYSSGTGYVSASTSAWLPLQATFFTD